MIKITTTQDLDRVNLIRQRLQTNGGYCPCRLIKNEDTKCICKEFRDAMEAGKACKCHCGLYEIIITQD